MKIFIFLLFPALLVSCSKSRGGSGKKKIISYQSNTSDEPISDVDVEVCEVTEMKSDFDKNFIFPVFIQNKLNFIERSFEKLLYETEIRSEDGSIITLTNYGMKLHAIFEDDRLVDGNFESYGDTIKICKGNKIYEPNTSQAAALSTNYVISKTRNRLIELDPTINISAIKLEIAPVLKIENRTTTNFETKTEITYRTDNAYYDYSQGKITFLPHSKMARSLGLGVQPFWRVPFISAHEYGHHVFYELTKNVRNVSETEEVHIRPCFNNRLTPRSKFLNGLDEKSKERKVGSMEIYQAMHEGIADLIAFYTLGTEERGLDGNKCLEISRSVDSAVFSNQEPKKFSTQVYDEFFSKQEIENMDRAICTNPDYQDGHYIGAIFAHQMDQFFTQLKMSDDEKLKAIIAWAKVLNVSWRSLEVEHATEPKEIFRQSVLLLINEAMKLKNVTILDSESCEKITDGFKVEEIFFRSHISGCI